MTKKEIIDEISKTVNFCMADGNTYLYAKCVSTVVQDDKKIPIGGGNFTVLLSTLATLEFLGTINAIIKGKSNDFWDVKETERLNKTQKRLKKMHKTEWIKNFVLRPFCNLPQTGTIKKSGISCLIDFLEETKGITGLNENEIKKIRTIRNKLAHEFTPKSISALGIGFMPGADFVSLILQYDKEDVFCLSSENRIGINSNALNRKLGKLLKYVVVKLDKLSGEKESEVINKIDRYLRDVK